MNSSSITGKKNKRSYHALLKFVKAGIGQDDNPIIRYWGMAIQLFAVLFFSISTFMWKYTLETDSWFLYLIGLVWNISSLVLLVHFSYGFFTSLRFNLPRMISTKNTIGLFLFAILFFETAILAFLFWVLTIILWYAESDICGSAFCSGMLTGLFGFVNIMAILCSLVLYICRRNLGISFMDSFGIF